MKTQLENWRRMFEKIYPKEGIEMADEYMEKYSILLTMKMQTKGRQHSSDAAAKGERDKKSVGEDTGGFL